MYTHCYRQNNPANLLSETYPRGIPAHVLKYINEKIHILFYNTVKLKT